jgi:hypothetical protein
VRRHSAAKPSTDRIGKLLCSAPFNGVSVKFRSGRGTFRGVIIRNHARWRCATGANVAAHIAGDDADIAVDSLLL